MSKTVLITGSSRGIGSSIAKNFAMRNYNVVINYNQSAKAASELASELAQFCRVILVKADVSKSADVAFMFGEIAKTFGGVDILINNAGVSQIDLLTDMSEAEICNILDINLKGAITVSRAAIPYMVGNKWGRIINISSIWGVSGASCEVVYSASKAGLIGMTKALAKELAPSGITVNCVAPGLIATEINSTLSQPTLDNFVADIPVGRIGRVEDVSSAVMFFATAEAAYITGQTLTVDGGYTI